MPSIDLSPVGLPPPTKLVEVRTSKLKRLGPVLSGIDKQLRQGQLPVSLLGLPDDEHDLTFHGGIDKAVHQYCSTNYDFWKSKYSDPDVLSRFVPGGFGENLVADGFCEENVCIGDLVQISHTDDISDDATDCCILEVSLPRQPCFKLNQRFGIKNFAPKTHQAAKTGWYYRVKQEGRIEAGMTMRVIRRDHPKWTITRLHHYVHRDRSDLEITQELMDIEVMGDECKDVFRTRWKDHLESQKPKEVEQWTQWTIISQTQETARVVKLGFKTQDPAATSTNVPVGSYALLRLPNGLQRAYSVISGTTEAFTLGVARDDSSRGGSAYIHDHLNPGDTVEVGSFKRSMIPSGMASHYIFIVGGIGITAFLAMMKKLITINQTLELHYAVRDPDDVAFREILSELGPDIHIYRKSEGERMDIGNILTHRTWNSQVFTCGPQRMIDAVIASAKSAGMADDEVYYELFAADTSGDPFSAEVVDKDRRVTVQVESNKSLLQTLREAGFDVPSSCETGSCGTCRIAVKEGRVEHRGNGLTADEKEGEMLSCVSRGIGHIVVTAPEVDAV
ncbi:MOSC domain-containing protein 2 [Elsinoe fawcettii]|nr:MOSC domain-containing protein 2 [Elsinoe fawcettii]